MSPRKPLLFGEVCGCLTAEAMRRIEEVDSRVLCRIVNTSLTGQLRGWEILGCGMVPNVGVQRTSVWSEQSPERFLIHQVLHSARL